MDEKGYNYFVAPGNYFWKWAEFGKVIEWENGTTICYTEDLSNIIRSLQGSGLPSLSVMLMVLAASSDNWKNKVTATTELFRNLAGTLPADNIITQQENQNFKGVIDFYISQAIIGMQRISELPLELRQDFYRAQIIREITGEKFIVVQQENVISVADDLPAFSNRTAVFIKSRNNDKGSATSQQFLKDLKCLAQIAEKYPTAQSLEQKLRTGLDAIPLPTPLEMPEQKPAGDLLQELLEEPQTEHISRLVRKMIAALHIPMHFQRSGGQSYGGISDITNRGNFDKLLLSELANDDNMLMTRLVNNEALYLRREEPPHNPKTRRLILIDSTIKLWGTPRVFAISAAIACTQNLRQNETVESYTLGGKDYVATDLATKKGVLQSLEQLDASLHCTAALNNCINEVASGANGDTIFITNAENIAEPAFQKSLTALGDALDFIITVNRNGELHFNSVSAGRMKQLSKAKIDLEEILAQKNQNKLPLKKKGKIDGLPMFFNMERPPLLFPAIHIRKSKKEYHYYHPKIGLFAITETMRLLWWQLKDKGAQELVLNVQKGSDYKFVYDGEHSLCLLIFREDDKTVNGYYFKDLREKESPVLEWEIEVKKIENNSHCGLKKDILLISTRHSWNDDHFMAEVYCINGKVTEYKKWEDCERFFGVQNSNLTNKHNTLTSIPGIKSNRFMNNGYTAIIRIKRIFIDVQNSLCINDQYLNEESSDTQYIQLQDGADDVKKFADHKYEDQPFAENASLWFRQFKWKDGSTATVDSRGLLHLKSSNTLLPEVSFVLIQAQSTACWASDGALCGNEYFRDSIVGIMPTQTFYKRYITPIIQTIIQKA